MMSKEDEQLEFVQIFYSLKMVHRKKMKKKRGRINKKKDDDYQPPKKKKKIKKTTKRRGKSKLKEVCKLSVDSIIGIFSFLPMYPYWTSCQLINKHFCKTLRYGMKETRYSNLNLMNYSVNYGEGDFVRNYLFLPDEDMGEIELSPIEDIENETKTAQRGRNLYKKLEGMVSENFTNEILISPTMYQFIGFTGYHKLLKKSKRTLTSIVLFKHDDLFKLVENVDCKFLKVKEIFVLDNKFFFVNDFNMENMDKFIKNRKEKFPVMKKITFLTCSRPILSRKSILQKIYQDAELEYIQKTRNQSFINTKKLLTWVCKQFHIKPSLFKFTNNDNLLDCIITSATCSKRMQLTKFLIEQDSEVAYTLNITSWKYIFKYWKYSAIETLVRFLKSKTKGRVISAEVFSHFIKTGLHHSDLTSLADLPLNPWKLDYLKPTFIEVMKDKFGYSLFKKYSSIRLTDINFKKFKIGKEYKQFQNQKKEFSLLIYAISKGLRWIVKDIIDLKMVDTESLSLVYMDNYERLLDSFLRNHADYKITEYKSIRKYTDFIIEQDKSTLGEIEKGVWRTLFEEKKGDIIQYLLKKSISMGVELDTTELFITLKNSFKSEESIRRFISYGFKLNLTLKDFPNLISCKFTYYYCTREMKMNLKNLDISRGEFHVKKNEKFSFLKFASEKHYKWLTRDILNLNLFETEELNIRFELDTILEVLIKDDYEDLDLIERILNFNCKFLHEISDTTWSYLLGEGQNKEDMLKLLAKVAKEKFDGKLWKNCILMSLNYWNENSMMVLLKSGVNLKHYEDVFQYNVNCQKAYELFKNNNIFINYQNYEQVTNILMLQAREDKLRTSLPHILQEAIRLDLFWTFEDIIDLNLKERGNLFRSGYVSILDYFLKQESCDEKKKYIDYILKGNETQIFNLSATSWENLITHDHVDLINHITNIASSKPGAIPAGRTRRRVLKTLNILLKFEGEIVDQLTKKWKLKYRKDMLLELMNFENTFNFYKKNHKLNLEDVGIQKLYRMASRFGPKIEEHIKYPLIRHSIEHNLPWLREDILKIKPDLFVDYGVLLNSIKGDELVDHIAKNIKFLGIDEHGDTLVHTAIRLNKVDLILHLSEKYNVTYRKWLEVRNSLERKTGNALLTASSHEKLQEMAHQYDEPCPCPNCSGFYSEWDDDDDDDESPLCSIS